MVYEKGYQIANILTAHAPEILDWKLSWFKRRMKQIAESLRKDGDIAQLYDW